MLLTKDLMGRVGLFFYAEQHWLIHTCSFRQAEEHNGFLNYPFSHEVIWEQLYFKKYHTDFDFYPRGRIIYDRQSKTYRVFHDICIKTEAAQFITAYSPERVLLLLDEHYQCHQCNRNYIHITRIAES